MELIEAGYFSRSHGTKGQLVFKSPLQLDVEKLKVIFIEAGGSQAPYFISEFKFAGADLVLSLEGVNNPEEAKVILNKSLLIDTNCVLKDNSVDKWMDFEVYDKKLGHLGKVKFSSENGAQDLIHLEFQGKEVILPLVEEFIIEINEERKQLKYDAPEGLIELYINEE